MQSVFSQVQTAAVESGGSVELMNEKTWPLSWSLSYSLFRRLLWLSLTLPWFCWSSLPFWAWTCTGGRTKDWTSCAVSTGNYDALPLLNISPFYYAKAFVTQNVDLYVSLLPAPVHLGWSRSSLRSSQMLTTTTSTLQPPPPTLVPL